LHLWIKNGHLLDPATSRDGIYDIYVKDHDVFAVGSFPSESVTSEMLSDCQVIDAKNQYVMPGFIDLHVHFREPGLEYKETIKTGSMAAARGGFTGVCPMPNTVPVTDCAGMVEKVLAIAKRDSKIHVYPVGAVTIGQKGEQCTDLKAMQEAGVCAISEDGKSVMNAELYREAMREAAKLGIPVLAHCEDKNMVGRGALNQGAASKRLGVEGITNAVEDVIVARDILIAKETGATLHLCHCSTKDSVEMVKMAKSQGVSVTAEVCPHHFSLTEDDIAKDDANYKMNPPLRTKEDVEALKKGLAEDIMDVIATDHAPHSAEEKAKPIANAPFGIVGLETAFALTVTNLVKTGTLTPMQMVQKMSQNPANVLGVRGGSLAEGMPADIVIADMDTPYEIDVTKFLSKGKNSPFGGMKVTGRVSKTIVGGEIIYDIDMEEDS
jgi:dihydroorotase